MDFAERRKREEWIGHKNMKAFTLVNLKWAISEIDVIIESPVDYKKAFNNINHITVLDVSVPVISIDDLIEMKKGTGRQQDKADIRYLKRLKEDEKG